MPNQPGLGTRVDLAAAPGADAAWEDLFPSEGATPPQTTAAPEQPPQEQPQATPPPPEFFIRASKSVYKTPEDAIKGLDEKDQLIDSLRQYAIERTGYDPVTRQPAPQAQPQAPASQYQYLGNGKKLFDDLSEAVNRHDPERYEQVLRTYNNEQLAMNFAPVAPLLSEVARQKAVRVAGKDIPSFLDSEDYKQTLEGMPTLREAIQTAESNFSMSDRLPELYQIAYLAAQGRRAQAAPPQPPQTPPPAARPTTAPSTMTPPAPTSAPDMRTSEGRKALIRDAESKGVLDFRF